MKSVHQTMDFFEHQDRAKANSRRFTALYLVAVLLICVAVSAVAGLIAWMANNGPGDSRIEIVTIVSLIAGAITALIVLGGSLHTASQNFVAADPPSHIHWAGD